MAGPKGTTNYTDAATAANLPGGVDNLLAGARNHASTDASFGEKDDDDDDDEDGFIWKAVLEAGGTVRNYGFLVNNFGSRVNGPYGAGEFRSGPLDPSLPRVDFTDSNDNLPPVVPTSISGATTRSIRTCGATPSGSGSSTCTSRMASCQPVARQVSHDHMGSFGFRPRQGEYAGNPAGRQ